VTWAVLGIIIVLLLETGRRFDLTLDKTATLSGATRADFIRGVKDGCVDSQQRKTPNRTAVMSHQIEIFCDCYANRLPGIVTTEEMRQWGPSGRMPAGVETKIAQLLSPCRQLALPQMQQSPAGLY
jgi:hypothetical protein